MDYFVNTALVSVASRSRSSSNARAVLVRNGEGKVSTKGINVHRYVSDKRHAERARCSSDAESDEDDFLDKRHSVAKDQDILDFEMDKVHTKDNTGDPRLRILTRLERSMNHLEAERAKCRRHIAEPEVYIQEEGMETSEEMIKMKSSDTSDDEDLSNDEIESVPKLTEITQRENGNRPIEQPCAKQDERKKGTFEKSLKKDQVFKKPQKRAVRGIKYRQLRFKLRWPAEMYKPYNPYKGAKKYRLLPKKSGAMSCKTLKQIVDGRDSDSNNNNQAEIPKNTPEQSNDFAQAENYDPESFFFHGLKLNRKNGGEENDQIFNDQLSTSPKTG